MHTSDHPRSTPSLDTLMIRQHGASLATIAWWGYTYHGRGVVVIDYTVPPDRCFGYVQQHEIATWSLTPDVVTLLRHLQHYDPLREVLCLVRHLPTSCQLYRWHVTNTVVPQAAWRYASAV